MPHWVQFLIREGALHCVTFMRSNDVICGLSYDLFLLTMLQERMALELGVRLGTHRHLVGSMHIFEPQFAMARAIAKSSAAPGVVLMPPMAGLRSEKLFLDLERRLRLNHPGSGETLQRLTPYWRDLAAPLITSSAQARGRLAQRW